MLKIVYYENISKKFIFFFQNGTVQSMYENEMSFLFQNEKKYEKSEKKTLFCKKFHIPIFHPNIWSFFIYSFRRKWSGEFLKQNGVILIKV